MRTDRWEMKLKSDAHAKLQADVHIVDGPSIVRDVPVYAAEVLVLQHNLLVDERERSESLEFTLRHWALPALEQCAMDDRNFDRVFALQPREERLWLKNHLDAVRTALEPK